MENEDGRKSDQRRNRNEEASSKEVRVVVSEEADAAITEFASAVNEDFHAGRATRFDAVNFMLLWFKKHHSEDAVFEIRRQLASGLTMLDAVLKQAKSTGELPAELKAALEAHFFGNAATAPRKGKKTLKSDIITDNVYGNEAA